MSVLRQRILLPYVPLHENKSASGLRNERYIVSSAFVLYPVVHEINGIQSAYVSSDISGLRNERYIVPSAFVRQIIILSKENPSNADSSDSQKILPACRFQESAHRQ